MQTLNVGAGQTDKEYKAAEEQRRADLLDESRSDANYFFLAAGLAVLGTGLLPVRVNVLVSIGTVDLLSFYGRPLGQLYSLALYSVAAMWAVVVLGLGFAARSGHRWAFLTGMVLYGIDMMALIMMFSLWAFGVHAFFLFKWFQGQTSTERSQRSGCLNMKGPSPTLSLPVSTQATLRTLNVDQGATNPMSAFSWLREFKKEEFRPNQVSSHLCE